MAPILYHVPKTISSPIYQIILELGLTDEDIHVKTLSFADLKTPEHLARNPMGTSPTLLDKENDFAIWESGAVLTYLLATMDSEHKLHPDPKVCSKADWAKFLHVQQFIIATVYPFLASLFIHTLQPAEKQDAEYVKNAKATFQTRLGPVLTNFLGEGPYFMGDTMSAIDFLVAKPLNNAHALGILEQDFPTLHQLFQRIQCKPSFATAYSVDTCYECNCRSLRLVPATEMESDDNKESRSITMH
jgi:glutathione S-transferase